MLVDEPPLGELFTREVLGTFDVAQACLPDSFVRIIGIVWFTYRGLATARKRLPHIPLRAGVEETHPIPCFNIL